MEMTRRLRITSLCTSITGHIPYFSSGELLRWETGPAGGVSTSLLKHHLTSYFWALENGEATNVCSRSICGGTSLCATICVLWREAVKCVLSFPGADGYPAQRLQGQILLVGSTIWPHPEVHAQDVPTRALSSLQLEKSKSLDKVKGVKSLSLQELVLISDLFTCTFCLNEGRILFL